MRVYPTLSDSDPKKLMDAINIISRIRQEDISAQNQQNFRINSIINGSTQTVLSGATTGSLTYSMPSQTVGYKLLVGYFSGYENASTVSQTIAFPTPFTNPPVVTQNGTTLSISASTSTLTINTPSSTVTSTGLLMIQGF